MGEPPTDDFLGRAVAVPTENSIHASSLTLLWNAASVTVQRYLRVAQRAAPLVEFQSTISS
jgi:hypothetical protein